MEVGALKGPLNGGDYCGDQFGYWRNGKETVLCIADGLGHGKHAEEAAKSALAYVARHLSSPLAKIFSGCNSAIRNTRGVAMGIAIIDEDARMLTYAGVGNTRIMIQRKADGGDTTAEILYLRSDYGIVGGGFKRLVPEDVPLQSGDLVVLYTDGVKEMINLPRDHVLAYGSVQKLAEMIINNWRIETDDAAVLVYRYGDP